MNATPTTLPIEARQPLASAGIGAQVARGAAWTLLFSLLTKAMTLGSQIALAWFLVPEEFGLVAITLSVLQFTAIVGSNNLRSLLVQRPAHFHQEAGQVFWLALALNLAAAFVLVLASPVAGRLFHEPRVVSLILVAAIAPPIQSLSTIYLAALQRDMKFRRIALIQCGAGAVQTGAAVLLAAWGAGAYSLVLPLILSAAGQVTAYRLSAGRIALGAPHPGRWPSMGSPIGWLIVNALFAALLASGASMVVGLVTKDVVIVGFYYWGFSISSQAIFLLVTNLQGVLFPAFNRLNAEPERQFAAFERAAKTLSVAIAPICALQWLLAEPLIQAAFHSRWVPAIPVVEWISLGLLTQPFYLLAVSVLLARGHFRKLAVVTGLVATTTLAGALIGAITGDQTEIARVAAFALLFANLGAGWATFREFGCGLTNLLSIASRTTVLWIAIAATGWFTKTHSAAHGTATQIVATTLAVVATHAIAVRLLFPAIASDLLTRLIGKPSPET